MMPAHERFLKAQTHGDVLKFVRIYGPPDAHDARRGFCRADSTLKVARLLGAGLRVLQEGRSGGQDSLREAVRSYLAVRMGPTPGGMPDANFDFVLAAANYSSMHPKPRLPEALDRAGASRSDIVDWFHKNGYFVHDGESARELSDKASDAVILSLANGIVRTMRPASFNDTMILSSHGGLETAMAFESLFDFIQWMIWRGIWDRKPLVECRNHIAGRRSKFCERFFHPVRKLQKYCCKQCANHSTVARGNERKLEEMISVAREAYTRCRNEEDWKSCVEDEVNAKTKPKRPIGSRWVSIHEDEIVN